MSQDLQEKEKSGEVVDGQYTQAAMQAAQAKLDTKFSNAFPVGSALNDDEAAPEQANEQRAEQKQSIDHKTLEHHRYDYRSRDLPTVTFGDEPFKPGDYVDEVFEKNKISDDLGETFKEAIERIAEKNGHKAKFKTTHFAINDESNQPFVKISPNGTVSTRTRDINHPAFNEYVVASTVHRFAKNEKPIYMWVNEAKMTGGQNVEQFFRTQIESLEANGIDIERLRIQNNTYQWILDEYKKPKATVTQDEMLVQDLPENAPAGEPTEQKTQDVEARKAPDVTASEPEPVQAGPVNPAVGAVEPANVEHSKPDPAGEMTIERALTLSELSEAYPVKSQVGYDEGLVDSVHKAESGKVVLENPYENIDYHALSLEEPITEPVAESLPVIQVDELADLDSDEHVSIFDIIKGEKANQPEPDEPFIDGDELPDATAPDVSVDSDQEFFKKLEAFDVDSVDFSAAKPPAANAQQIEDSFRISAIEDDIRSQHRPARTVKFGR
ncbi:MULTISPECIES: hypothetical protein [Pseudomonas]|uniref:Uncharacterized protein n=1 Tax=Pseudomonas helleri TaxID=1608996 RepID=A0A7X1WBZ2_9PSED|nr:MULTISPECIES: hypothetical protein [Pseudomonas]MQT49010.1 hypothetical protein [Pseudomonas helleri]